ncbi:hypothetical protein ACJX0J_016343, partial [Zea mays]
NTMFSLELHLILRVYKWEQEQIASMKEFTDVGKLPPPFGYTPDNLIYKSLDFGILEKMVFVNAYKILAFTHYYRLMDFSCHVGLLLWLGTQDATVAGNIFFFSSFEWLNNVRIAFF